MPQHEALVGFSLVPHITQNAQNLRLITFESSLIANARTFSAFLHVRTTTGFVTSYSGT